MCEICGLRASQCMLENISCDISIFSANALCFWTIEPGRTLFARLYACSLAACPAVGSRSPSEAPSQRNSFSSYREPAGYRENSYRDEPPPAPRGRRSVVSPDRQYVWVLMASVGRAPWNPKSSSQCVRHAGPATRPPARW